jgi:hypothetical protein
LWRLRLAWCWCGWPSVSCVPDDKPPGDYQAHRTARV